MKEWILPCNPKMYRIGDALREQKIIDWRKTRNLKSVQDGDIVYIYLSAPFSQIAYKGAVLKAEKPENTLDDSAYTIPPGNATSGPCMEIAVFRVYEYGGLDINTLKANGLTSNLQCPVSVNKELSNYLNACDRIQSNSDMLLHDIPEECLVPFPIKIPSNVINKEISLPPLELSDDGKMVTCANCQREFMKADKCPHCGQLIIYTNRFFGNSIEGSVVKGETN